MHFLQFAAHPTYDAEILYYLQKEFPTTPEAFTMPEKKIQEYLFQRIREILPAGRSLVDTVAEVLCVSPDSAYRRIRGETLLVLEEARILCRQFNLSLDQLLELSGESVVFQNIKLQTQTDDFKGYLQGILRQINHLNTFENKSIVYVTSDVPVFHQFSSPAFFAFRYFFWMKTMFQHPDFSNRKFSLDCLTPEIESLGREILTVYNKIPSVEIWNTESINSTLSQVNYYYNSDLMTREEMFAVQAGVRHMLEHLQVQAEYGCKFLPGEKAGGKKENFQLFYNRVGLGDNAIMTLHDGGKTFYLNYDSLNYLLTTDEAFCNEVYQKMQTIMRRSTLISSVSEKQRNIFFNTLYAKIPLIEIVNKKLAS